MDGVEVESQLIGTAGGLGNEMPFSFNHWAPNWQINENISVSVEVPNDPTCDAHITNCKLLVKSL